MHPALRKGSLFYKTPPFSTFTKHPNFPVFTTPPISFPVYRPAATAEAVFTADETELN